MLTEQTRIIYDQIDRGRLEETLRGISSHHRIQASPGYHDAAVFCMERLRQQGLAAEICSYPAREGVYFQNSPSFDYWSCEKAWCRLTDTGELLADFSQNPFSLIQRSAPWFEEDRELEIIELDRGTDEAAYEGIDFTGKLVFVHEEYSTVRDWAVEKRGAIGYISDYVVPEPGVRNRADMHDIYKYTSFWWRPGQKRVFGFVLSPDQGDRLHALCSALAKQGRRPTVTCCVDSAFSAGALEVVTAQLPGATGEEILLCAHLCHPFGSANDNASGASAVLEALIHLKQLIDGGVLAPPQRSIRIILVPEIIGSYAYLDSLSAPERERIRLALTLDMVGGKQDGRGPLTLFETPHCTPSIGNSLAIAILNELRRDVLSLNPFDRIPLFNSAVHQYIDGSDHGVLNDPQLGISSPLLCQWPDKTYHTSGDTPDVIDYDLLRHSCALAASYAYHAAALSVRDFPELAQVNFQRMQESLTQRVFHARESGLSRAALQGFAADHLRYYKGCLRSFVQLVPQAQELLPEELERLDQAAKLCIGSWLSRLPDAPAGQTLSRDARVPVRSFFGRMDYGFSWICAEREDGFPAFAAYQKAVEEQYSADMEGSIIYYINGSRSVAEIAALVSDEYGTDASLVTEAYVQLLEAAGLITFAGGNVYD